MRIIGNKLGEFQEVLNLSLLEAKHIHFNSKYGRSTTSRIVYNNNNSTMSAQGLAFYQYIIRDTWFNKPNVLFLMAWLCFLYFFINVASFDYDCLNMLYFLPVSLKHPKGSKQSFSTSPPPGAWFFFMKKKITPAPLVKIIS